MLHGLGQFGGSGHWQTDDDDDVSTSSSSLPASVSAAAVVDRRQCRGRWRDFHRSPRTSGFAVRIRREEIMAMVIRVGGRRS